LASTKFFDRYQSTLSSAYTSGGSSLAVAGLGSGASALPSTGDFYVLVEAEGSNTEEVLKVTAISGSTLTVTGAQAGTAASNHASGAQIRGPIVTAGCLNQFRQDVIQTGLDAAKTAEKAGNLYIPSNGFGLYRDNGAAFVPFGPLFPFTAPDNSQFTWINQTSGSVSGSVSTTNGGIFLRAPAVGGENWRLRAKAVPGSTPYQVTAAFVYYAPNTAFPAAGIWIGDSGTTPKFYAFVRTMGAIKLYRYTSPTAFSATDLTHDDQLQGAVTFLRIANDGTNLVFSVSADGQNFEPVSSISKTAFLTAPSQWGICTNAGQATNAANLTLLSWAEA
jgi:hypothetical protein